MEHTTAIIFAALALIGVAVVILTTIRKTKDKKASQADKENADYIDSLKREREETAFMESYQWVDDPSIPPEDEWKTKPCKVRQRNDRHKIISTTYGEAYNMAKKYIDMCFEHFEGRSSLWLPFVVEAVDYEDAIEERNRLSERFWFHCDGYCHKKRVESNAAKKKV